MAIGQTTIQTTETSVDPNHQHYFLDPRFQVEDFIQINIAYGMCQALKSTQSTFKQKSVKSAPKVSFWIPETNFCHLLVSWMFILLYYFQLTWHVGFPLLANSRVNEICWTDGRLLMVSCAIVHANPLINP